MEDHQPQPTGDDGPAESEASVAMTEQQMWLAAMEGKNKGRVFGLGSEAHCTTRTYTYRSPSPPPPPPPPTSEPGHGGPHDPPRGDDGRHDGHDAGDASDLHCRTVTAHCLQCRPSTASTASHRPPATHR
ncbi:UNVERIFIED_CONTAM: hypothetical protein Slati_4218200 [Sesamum latifolium]|uniref:Uncharacterized protein n=1 Tax=Sesamum latifolium TaxID=2727402 RepID=A0AAW2TCN7_9LAMI